jgi:hypothetical protein
MSSDPTRPLPPPGWNPEAPTQQYPAGGQRQPQGPGEPPTRHEKAGGQPRPTFTPNPQYPPNQQQPPQQQQQQPSQQPYQPPQQQQQGWQPEPPQQSVWESEPPRYDQQQRMMAPAGRAGRRRRRRWPFVTGIVIVVLLLLAVGADRFACYEAENTMANKIVQNGLPVKPHVSIEGFPFLTQLAAKDFNNVVISASNVTEGSLTIASINATLHGMHLIDGYSGARIDSLTGSALIKYSALASAGGFPSGITLGPGSSSGQIKATVSVPILGNQSVTAQVTRQSASEFNIKVVDADGVDSTFLGNLVNYTYKVPQLPAGMGIESVSTNQQGVVITITGQNTTLTQS